MILSISDYFEFLSVQISLTDASSKEEEKNGILLANLSSLTMRKKLFLRLKISFKAEDREFAKFLRPPEQFIQTVKDQDNFFVNGMFF